MRRLALIGLLAAAACSWDEQAASVTIHVNGIPSAADHLDVTMTLPDQTTKTFRPSFQPEALPGGAVDLAFSPSATSGTVSFTIAAADRNALQLATGSVSGALPGPTALQVTLH